MPPLIVYLDTQDYINLFNEASDGPSHGILEQLVRYRDRGEIAIGYSWATIIEFITRPTDEFREERVRRGRLVKDICGRNAFPFFTELKNGARFPNNGNWLGGVNGKMITAKWWRGAIKRQYLEVLSSQSNLSRAQRRLLKTKSGMWQLLRESNSTWGTRRDDFAGFPVSDELVASGVITRFMKGQCSDGEFEDRINRWLFDPAEFSRIYYDYADKPNFFHQFAGPSLERLEDSLNQLQQARSEVESKKASLKQALIRTGLDKRNANRLTRSLEVPGFETSDAIIRLEDMLGGGRADHIVHYLRKAAQKTYRFKRSDLMDIIHMVYVQDCDLFRCDKAMAELYRDFEPFAGKLVSRFSNLPRRIEEHLRSSSA